MSNVGNTPPPSNPPSTPPPGGDDPIPENAAQAPQKQVAGTGDSIETTAASQAASSQAVAISYAELKIILNQIANPELSEAILLELDSYFKAGSTITIDDIEQAVRDAAEKMFEESLKNSDLPENDPQVAEARAVFEEELEILVDETLKGVEEHSNETSGGPTTTTTTTSESRVEYDATQYLHDQVEARKALNDRLEKLENHFQELNLVPKLLSEQFLKERIQEDITLEQQQKSRLKNPDRNV